MWGLGKLSWYVEGFCEKKIKVFRQAKMFRNNGEGTTTSLVVGKKLKVQTSYPNGVERVEEWQKDEKNSKLLVLLTRKFREPTKLSLAPDWEWEIGQPKKRAAGAGTGADPAPTTISISTLNPSWHCFDSLSHLEFRVKNAPWSIENYKVGVNDDNTELILRTVNKKFYKKFQIPSLVRLGVKLDESCLSMKYSDDENELTIRYKKPDELRECDVAEKLVREKSGKDGGGGECTQS